MSATQADAATPGGVRDSARKKLRLSPATVVHTLPASVLDALEWISATVASTVNPQFPQPDVVDITVRDTQGECGCRREHRIRKFTVPGSLRLRTPRQGVLQEQVETERLDQQHKAPPAAQRVGEAGAPGPQQSDEEMG